MAKYGKFCSFLLCLIFVCMNYVTRQTLADGISGQINTLLIDTVNTLFIDVETSELEECGEFIYMPNDRYRVKSNDMKSIHPAIINPQEEKAILNVNKEWKDSNCQDDIRLGLVDKSIFPIGNAAFKNNNTPTSLTITKIPSLNINLLIKTTSITLSKVWNDDNNQDGLRPDSVMIQLKANGEPKGEPIMLNAVNNWFYIWPELPLFRDGISLVYTAEEVSVPAGYTASAVVIGVNKNSSYSITLTNTHAPKTINKKVLIIWDDNNNKSKLRPNSVQVQLYANGMPYDPPTTLDRQNRWQYTWYQLPKYTQNNTEVRYTLEEVNVPFGYVVSRQIINANEVEMINSTSSMPKTSDFSLIHFYAGLMTLSTATAALGFWIKKKAEKKSTANCIPY